MKSISSFLREVSHEMSRVVWPKKNDVFLTLVLVVIVGFILSMILLAMDYAVMLFLSRVLGVHNG
jgi:preprotein translocase SecE subunit